MAAAAAGAVVLLGRAAFPPQQAASAAEDHAVQLQEQDVNCHVLWRQTVSDSVANGWGSSALHFGIMYVRFDSWVPSCSFITSQAISADWEKWGLHMPGNQLAEGDWGSEAAQEAQSVDSHFQVSILGPWPGETLGSWSAEPTTRTILFESMAGCHPQYDDMMMHTFGDLVANTETVAGDYIGLHVRHGDKSSEGPLSDFSTIMENAKRWPMIKDIWLATDDASVISDETAAYQEQGYSFNWADYSRWEGGEPSACEGQLCHHNTDEASIRAVLADTLNLARARVLIGNFNSNFFRIAWIMNYLRRDEAGRAEEWCFDVLTGLSCSNRRDFVNQWMPLARDNGVPDGMLPGDIGIVQSCGNPYGG